MCIVSQIMEKKENYDDDLFLWLKEGGAGRSSIGKAPLLFSR